MVKESVPTSFNFSTDEKKSEGPPTEIKVIVYCYTDPQNTGDPQHRISG